MGDLHDWSPELENEQNHVVIEVDSWEVAEKATQEILTRVQPTVVSEKRRNDVIEYVQRLIKDCLGYEVFQFGSVPLKTYLPDGDIDLTLFGGLNLEDALADSVYSVLERGEHNTDAKFVVKDVQLVPAEVKLVKCIVQNIVVDISFNQLGGLCTLCFLEQVDRLIGKSNLFKRSIILIKAWCYYESRILGAHHGLISTYALETLVLYIFHLFHSSLNGPLGVLYKFLEYYSKFDWENYCISLNGPIRLSSLPEQVVVAPENYGGGLLFSDAYLKDCMDMFADPSRVSEMSRSFPPKHFNIVDPLRESNNLGRSVSKGNFYRIQSALNFGARKLGRILSLPNESLADEIHNFFSNTLDRHKNDLRPDVQDPSPSIRTKTCQEDGISSDLGSSDFLEDSYCNGVNNYQILSEEMELSSPKLLEMENHTNTTATSGFGLSKDENDLIVPIIQDLKISDETYKPGYSSSCVTNGEASHEEQEPILGNHNKVTVVSRTDLSNPTSFDALMVDVDTDYKKSPELFDFSGEFVNHLNSLEYGKGWYSYAVNSYSQWSPRLSPRMLSHSANSYFPQTAFYVPVTLATIPSTNVGSEDKPKIRGTGTYFPNTDHYRDRQSNPRVKNPVQARSPRYNGQTLISPRRRLSFKANGSLLSPERGEFAPFVDPPTKTTTSESSRQPMNEHSFVQTPYLSLPILVPRAPTQMQVLGPNQDTAGKKSYRLKDADDFPPLSI